MEAELKTMEQMAAKAEQRAKYILDGYLSSQSQPIVESAPEAPEATPQNTLVAPTPEAPKPKKKVFKLKNSD